MDRAAVRRSCVRSLPSRAMVGGSSLRVSNENITRLTPEQLRAIATRNMVDCAFASVHAPVLSQPHNRGAGAVFARSDRSQRLACVGATVRFTTPRT